MAQRHLESNRNTRQSSKRDRRRGVSIDTISLYGWGVTSLSKNWSSLYSERANVTFGRLDRIWKKTEAVRQGPNIQCHHWEQTVVRIRDLSDDGGKLEKSRDGAS